MYIRIRSKMQHTKETVLIPDWRMVVKGMGAVVLLIACYALVMAVADQSLQHQNAMIELEIMEER
jgi:hypothetical protein